MPSFDPRSCRRSFSSLAALLVAAIHLAGCGAGTGDTETVDHEIDALNPVYGVDYSWARPSPAALHADGYAFAARYLSYEPSKNISAGEVQALRAAGLDTVVVWEQGSTDMLDGYARGVEHAQAADAQAKAAGMPAGRPIYFAATSTRSRASSRPSTPTWTAWPR